MQTGLQLADYIVFLVYFVVVSGYGYWIYQRKKSVEANSKDFFLAEGALTWWAIGASLIASNISAEQFIGMSGSGFAMGLAIASYEWMAALTLIVVAVFFLPIYLKNNIATMPQFLTTRYDSRVGTVMAVFWLIVYVVVNLTSILYLGALCLESILNVPFMVCAIGLALFALIITLGGMKVIGYTDVIQVVVLIMGGLATTYLALDLVSQHFGSGGGFFAGLKDMYKAAPSHFHMILNEGQLMMPDGAGGTKDAYMDLPGLSVLIGGMWIANLNYWGCNQYITQRALGTDLETGRKGLLFAAFLKLLMPVIVVLPGIAAYVLFKEGVFTNEMMDGSFVKPDKAYPTLLNLLPIGLKGLSFAALTAAIVASLAGKANSIATIYTLDIYKKFINKDANEKIQIGVGRLAIVVSCVISVILAPMLTSLGQGFQYIQEYTGFISPGSFAIFLLGFFWKRTTSNAALAAAVLTIPLSVIFKIYTPEIPFIDRMGIVFLVCCAIMVLISILESNKPSTNALEVDTSMYKTSTSFTIGAIVVCAALAVLYIMFW